MTCGQCRDHTVHDRLESAHTVSSLYLKQTCARLQVDTFWAAVLPAHTDLQRVHLCWMPRSALMCTHGAQTQSDMLEERQWQRCTFCVLTCSILLALCLVPALRRLSGTLSSPSNTSTHNRSTEGWSPVATSVASFVMKSPASAWCNARLALLTAKTQMSAEPCQHSGPLDVH